MQWFSSSSIKFWESMQAIKEEFGGRIGEVRENGSLTKYDITPQKYKTSLLYTQKPTFHRDELNSSSSSREITHKLYSEFIIE